MTENIAYYQRHGYTETRRATQDGFRMVFFRKTIAHEAGPVAAYSEVRYRTGGPACSPGRHGRHNDQPVRAGSHCSPDPARA